MTFQKDLLEAGKEKVTQLKSFLDELEVQLALGKAEARDVFEREKKNLNQFLNEEKARLQRMSEMAEDHRRDLQLLFEKLEASLYQDFPTNKRKFDSFKKESLQAIYELEAGLKEAYGDVGEEMQRKLDEFKAKLDAYRIQLALGSMEEETELAERKQSLQKSIGEIRTRLAERTSHSGKVDHFVDEISESFEHFKKAFSDLLN